MNYLYHSSSGLENRPYQSAGWERMANFTKQWIRNELENPKDIDLWTTMPIWMATGSGKTAVVGKHIQSIFSYRDRLEHLHKKSYPMRILVLNNQINLIDQLKTAFIDGKDGKPPLFGHDILNHTHVKVFHSASDNSIDQEANEEEYGDLQGKDEVYFSTFGSAKKYMQEAKGRDIIIIDEGHHIKAPTYMDVIQEAIKKGEEYNNRTPLVIPMSATMSPVLDIVNDPVVNFPIPEYIASGFAPDISYNLVTSSDFTDVQLAELQQWIDRIGKITDYNEKKSNIEEIRAYIETHLARFGGLEDLCRDLVNRLEALDHTIIFASSIEEVDQITAEINNLTGDQNTAIALHSKISDSDANVLQEYASGKKKIIVAVDKLNEGIDMPQTNNVVFWRNTKSPTIFQQQFGRGLRGKKVNFYDYTGVLGNMAWVNGINTEVQEICDTEKKYNNNDNKREGETNTRRKGIDVLIGNIKAGTTAQHTITLHDIISGVFDIESGLVVTVDILLDRLMTDFTTVEKFDEMPVRSVGGRHEYKACGKGITSIGKILGISGVNMYSKQGKNAVRRCLFPHAEAIIETTAETILLQLKKDFTTVEKFDEIPVQKWLKYKACDEGVTSIGTILGIKGINMEQKQGKLAVRKILFPDAAEVKEVTAGMILEQMKKDFKSVASYDAIPMQGPGSRIAYKAHKKGVKSIGTILGIKNIDMEQKQGKLAVRKILFPDAVEEVVTSSMLLEQMKKDFKSVEVFDKMPAGAGGWESYKAHNQGPRSIGTILGITGVKMRLKEGKNAVRAMLFPDASPL